MMDNNLSILLKHLYLIIMLKKKTALMIVVTKCHHVGLVSFFIITFT